MAAIGSKQDEEWKRLRKQLLALKDRLRKRERIAYATNEHHTRQNYIRGSLMIVRDIVSSDVFMDIIGECRN